MAEVIATKQKKKNPLLASLLERVSRTQQWLLTDPELAAERDAASKLPATPQPDHAANAQSPTPEYWRTDAPGLDELLWGEGWAVPLGEHMTTVMVRAFGLNKEMSVLDLTGGLGGSGAMIVEAFGSYVTALEADKELAVRGVHYLKQKSAAHHATLETYAPEKFLAKRRFDGIIARELFYRMADKPALVAEIAKSLKDHAHLSWTDLVLADPVADEAALQAWLRAETAGTRPLRLAEVEPLWTKNRVELRVSEDRTGHYIDAVQGSLAKLVRVLQGQTVAPETKQLIMNRVEFWAQRVNAFNHGLRFYRFYGTKHG